MKRSLWLMVVILVVSSISCVWAKWYKGIIHVHSTYSDGDRTPAMLKNAALAAGCDFLIVTDHDDSIPLEKKPTRTDLVTADFGIDKYLKDFTVTEPLLCIAGAEIAKKGVHIVAIPTDKNVFQEYPDDLQGTLNKMKEYGIISVAAHPSLEEYYYPRDLKNPPAGIEAWNEGSVNSQKTLAWHLDEIKKGRKPILMAGCDSHSSFDPSKIDALRWRRITYVWVEGELTVKSLTRAIANGQTYAANNGGYFEKLNLVPCLKVQEVERPKFEFTIGFSAITVSKKIIRIYRDGKLAKGSSIILPAGNNKYTYSWEDAQALKGEHVYVIEMEGSLITSPIVLRVNSSAKSPLVLKTTLVSQDGDKMALIADNMADFELTFEVNVKHREGSVFFRLSSDSEEVMGFRDGLNGYGLIFCPFPNQGANPGIYLAKRTDGYEDVLAYAECGQTSSGQAQFKLVVRGEQMQVYLKDKVVLQAQDSDFKTGRLVWRVFGDEYNRAEANFKIASFVPLKVVNSTSSTKKTGLRLPRIRPIEP